MNLDLYFYKMNNIRAVDGDTIRGDVDLGMNISANNVTIRVNAIDCYETRRNSRAKRQAARFDIELNEVIEKGKRAKEEVNKIAETYDLYVRTISKDSFGRWLGDVYYSNNGTEFAKLSHHLMNESLAHKYGII